MRPIGYRRARPIKGVLITMCIVWFVLLVCGIVGAIVHVRSGV